MRLFLTASFVVIGLAVAGTANAGTSTGPQRNSKGADFQLPAACTQIEKQIGIAPIACGIHSADELVRIMLALETSNAGRVNNSALHRRHAS